MASTKPSAEEPSELSNFRDAGDPVIGNPFPPENPRHGMWREATLKAEEELCLLNSKFMKEQPTREGLWDIERRFHTWALDMVAAKFDIWAKRGCYVVWDEQDLKVFDE